MHAFRLLVTGLAFAAVPVAASALEQQPETQLMWRLAFGADRAIETGYRLAIGYPADRGIASSPLLELEVADADAFVRLAGVPLWTQGYRADADASSGRTDAEATPWYSRQWVWWTAGGIAATLALAGSGGSDSEQHTLQIQDNGSGPATINGDTQGGYDLCAADGDACAHVPGEGFLESRRDIWERQGEPALDDGSGGMGDLLAR